MTDVAPRAAYKQPSVANTSAASASPIRSPGSGAGYNMLAGYNPAGSGSNLDPKTAAALGAAAAAIFGGLSESSPKDVANQILGGKSDSIVDKVANAVTGGSSSSGRAPAAQKPASSAPSAAASAGVAMALNKLKEVLTSKPTSQPGAQKPKMPASVLNQILKAAAQKNLSTKAPTSGGVAGGEPSDQQGEEQPEETDQTDQIGQTDETDLQDQTDEVGEFDDLNNYPTDTTVAEEEQPDLTEEVASDEGQQGEYAESDATVDDVNTALANDLGIEPDVVDLGDNFFYDKTSGNVYELSDGSLTDVTSDFESAFNEYGVNLPDFSSDEDISSFVESLPDINIGEYADLIPDFDTSQFDFGEFDLPDFSDLSLSDLGDYFELPSFDEIDFGSFIPSYDDFDFGSFDSGESEDSIDWGDFFGKKGGLAHLKNGGTAKVKKKYGLPRFEDGSLVDAGEIDSSGIDYSSDYEPVAMEARSTDMPDVGDYGVTSEYEGGGDYENAADYGDAGEFGDMVSTGTISGGAGDGAVDAQGRTVETTPDGINIYRDTEGKIVKVTDPNGYDITDDAREAALNGDDPEAAAQFAMPTDIVRTVYNPDGTRQEITRSGQKTTYDKNNQVVPDAFSLSRLGEDISKAFTAGKGPLSSIGTLLKNPIIQGGVTAGLLSQVLGGGTDKSYKGVDMSKVGQIAPRTTPFGMGPARTVSLGEATAMAPQQQVATNAALGVPGYSKQYESSPAPALPQPMKMPGMASGGLTHYTYGAPVDPYQNLGIERKRGGLTRAVHPESGVPVVQGRHDYREGSRVTGAGDGQSDDIPAMLADGEYVIDAELVSMLGNGSTKAGAELLDKFREQVRKHKRSAPLNKIPPKSKSPLTYLKEAKNG